MNKIGFFSYFLPKKVDLFSKRAIMSKDESEFHKLIGSMALSRAFQNIGGKRK